MVENVRAHAQSACLRIPFVFVRQLPAVFVFDSLMNCTMASKEAYLATELDRARGCNLEDSNLAAVIEDYFEGRVEPVEVASAGAGEDHIEPALVGSAPAGADFPNWGN